MASKTLGNLTAATALTGTEQVYVVQSSNSRRSTTQDVADLGTSQDNMTDGATNKNYSATDKTKVGHLTVTGDVDLDTISTKVGHITVSADIDLANVVQTDFISGLTEDTSPDWRADYLWSLDATDSSNKKALLSNAVKVASALVALTDGTSIALDWTSGVTFSVTLAGNRTLSNPTNGEPGTWRTIVITQDATGSRTLAFGTDYKFPGGTAPTLSTAASAVDVLSILCVTASVFYVFSALDLS